VTVEETNNSKKDSLARAIFSPRMFTALVMGFSCGLPLLLTIGLLQAWMKDEGVDLTVIGLAALLGVPYTMKFLWAPFLDRFTLPFLGRRRGWLLIAQLGLMGAIIALGLSDPGKNLTLLALCALGVTFFSASQDIVVDAYRREDLTDKELGLGSSLYIFGYRVGMLLAGGGGLVLADHMSFGAVYGVMAACMLPGVLTTLLTREPPVYKQKPRTLRESVVDPLVEFFGRNHAITILAFILLYKIGDSMAAAISTPFYLDVGYTKTEIGLVVKLFGVWAVIGGAMLGGVIMLRLGINRSLWVFGFLQAISTAGFALLAVWAPGLIDAQTASTWLSAHVLALAAIIAFENVSSGMGTTAYMAFMASITDKRFTATQYALLTSLMGVPRVFASSSTGFLAKSFGWAPFFVFCTLIAIPGMLLLFKFAPWKDKMPKLPKELPEEK
jgi:PAT family beta-lactamase induction signal transducer AmpG